MVEGYAVFVATIASDEGGQAFRPRTPLQFFSSTVFQERNAHDLMRDFAEEAPDRLHNERIRKTPTLPPARARSATSSSRLRASDQAELAGPDERPLDAARVDDLAACGLARSGRRRQAGLCDRRGWVHLERADEGAHRRAVGLRRENGMAAIMVVRRRSPTSAGRGGAGPTPQG